MKLKKGFTLLELIIVVIVIGILASLALPRYIRMVEKARSAEARQVLGAIRSAQVRHYAVHGNYTGDLARLDIEFTTPKHYDYTTLALWNPASPNPDIVAAIQRNADSPVGAYWVGISGDGNMTFQGCNPPDTACAFLD